MGASAAGTRRLRVPVWALVLLIVGGGAAGGAASAVVPRSYQATATVVVSAEGASVQDLAQVSAFESQVVASCSGVTTTPLVLDPVISGLGLRTTPVALARQISVDHSPDTTALGIRVSDRSPARSAAIANAVAGSLSRVAGSLSPQSASAPSVRVVAVEPARASAIAMWPRVLLSVVAGAAGGTVLVLLILLLNTWPPTPPTGRWSPWWPPR